MSNDQPTRRPGGKSGGAPMGSTVSIVIAVIAVVVGFLILRNISDSDGGSTSAGNETTNSATGGSSDVPGTETTVAATAPVETGPPTTPLLNTDATQVIIVANASGLGGAAGQYSKALAGLGFTVGTPTDATIKVDLSVVYYLPGGEAVAASVAQAMGSLDGTGVVASPMPTPVPLNGAIMPAGSSVLVMLGKDLAGKALPISAGTTVSTALPTAPIDSTTTTVAG